MCLFISIYCFTFTDVHGVILDPYRKGLFTLFAFHSNPHEASNLFYTQMEAEMQWLLLRSPVSIARMWTHLFLFPRPVFFLPRNSCSENQSRMMLIESVVDRLENHPWCHLRKGMTKRRISDLKHFIKITFLHLPHDPRTSWEACVFHDLCFIILVMRSDRGLLINKPMNHLHHFSPSLGHCPHWGPLPSSEPSAHQWACDSSPKGSMKAC